MEQPEDSSTISSSSPVCTTEFLNTAASASIQHAPQSNVALCPALFLRLMLCAQWDRIALRNVMLNSLLAVATVADIGIPQTMADAVFSQPGGFGVGQQNLGQASNVLGTHGQGEQHFAEKFV